MPLVVFLSNCFACPSGLLDTVCVPACLSFWQVLGQPKATIKVALFSIDIRRALSEDHDEHSLKRYNFGGNPIAAEEITYISRIPDYE